MASSYAALIFVMQTIHHLKIHPRPPISLDQEQLHSLTQNLTFFQHFLESYPSYEDDHLESRIANAAYAAEDVIETHIVDRIEHAGSTSGHGKNISSVDLYAGLERVIQDMDLIRRELMKIMRAQHHHPNLHTNSSGEPAAASTWQSSTMPVFDDAMINKVLDKLTGQQSGLQIIPIVGMGGIGKTTFARNIYTNPLVDEHFDIRAWVTISQEYSRINILQLLYKEVKGSTDGLSEMSEDEIGLILYQHLCGRRYLIVMDDIWSVDAWDKVKSFFPDNNGSRIMITTKLSNLAFQLSGSHDFHMQFLDEDKSWDLLFKIVFGKLDCPIELEDIGKEISKKCRGLPLSIAVIGGLLKKSNMTRSYWISTLENLSLIINLENNEYTLQILRTSYMELLMHLKPCFLYMGIFPEDNEIKTSVLIRLWVSEGILRPIDDKSLEEVGKEYMKELTDRNLILIPKFRRDGEARLCKLHDLLRDVCLREAQKQKFFCLLRQQKHHTPRGINMERRICINPENTDNEYSPQFLHAVESASLTRSLLYKMHEYPRRDEGSPSLRFRLLRVYSSVETYDIFATYANNVVFELANLRYLYLTSRLRSTEPELLPLSSLLWNLQTLKVHGPNPLEPTSEIWKMPLLRHVTLPGFAFPDPPHGEDNFVVLEHLQTLSGIKNFKLSEEVVKRIPNIKKLVLTYESAELDEEELPDFCFNNIGRLRKLESLNLQFEDCEYCDAEKIRRSLVSFPHSLKKLILCGTRLMSWEELTLRIGSLPLLQLLKLKWDACVGPRWETIEGQFCSLKILKIVYSTDLKYWDTDSSHFPRLEHLCLQAIKELEEIPSSIGDIPTLKSIRLECCSRSAADSARRIKQEQEDYGNEDLQIEIDINLTPPDDVATKEEGVVLGFSEDTEKGKYDLLVSEEFLSEAEEGIKGIAPEEFSSEPEEGIKGNGPEEFSSEPEEGIKGNWARNFANKWAWK